MAKDCAIIIPAYNAAATIVETLNSIQHLPSGMERIHSVIVADDCSTDSTSRVATETWVHPVPLIVTVNTRNLGERETVNRAAATLPTSVLWFYILHADDIA